MLERVQQAHGKLTDLQEKQRKIREEIANATTEEEKGQKIDEAIENSREIKKSQAQLRPKTKTEKVASGMRRAGKALKDQIDPYLNETVSNTVSNVVGSAINKFEESAVIDLVYDKAKSFINTKTIQEDIAKAGGWTAYVTQIAQKVKKSIKFRGSLKSPLGKQILEATEDAGIDSAVTEVEAQNFGAKPEIITEDTTKLLTSRELPPEKARVSTKVVASVKKDLGVRTRRQAELDKLTARQQVIAKAKK